MYQVTGNLMKGFLGNISYEVVLPEEVEEIEVQAAFEKRKMEEITEADRLACIKAYQVNAGKKAEENMAETMIQQQKTEINVSIFHRGAYLGCAHRDEMEKMIRISPENATPGFRTWRFNGGVLKVVLHVYQVLNDETPYRVTIRKGSDEKGNENAVSEG